MFYYTIRLCYTLQNEISGDKSLCDYLTSSKKELFNHSINDEDEINKISSIKKCQNSEKVIEKTPNFKNINKSSTNNSSSYVSNMFGFASPDKNNSVNVNNDLTLNPYAKENDVVDNIDKISEFKTKSNYDIKEFLLSSRKKEGEIENENSNNNISVILNNDSFSNNKQDIIFSNKNENDISLLNQLVNKDQKDLTTSAFYEKNTEEETNKKQPEIEATNVQNEVNAEVANDFNIVSYINDYENMNEYDIVVLVSDYKERGYFAIFEILNESIAEKLYGKKYIFSPLKKFNNTIEKKNAKLDVEEICNIYPNSVYVPFNLVLFNMAITSVEIK